MALKINSASGSITLTAEDGSGNADVTIPRDGIVSDLSDLSITATATELNYVDGVTSNIQTQLDAKGTVSTLADLSVTASAAELNLLDGVTATTTELNYVDGVTSAIQTQIDGKLSTSLKGAASGLAELDSSGLVPTSQLPSYVDDVLEYTNASSFPGTGETGKIYVALDTNDIYRWSGSAYVKVSDAVSTSDQATALATARTIALTGDVTGSTSFDGSANVSITATIADDSHNHVISNVDGLQTALDGKLATTAKAADSDLLDGINSSSFLRSDAADVFSGASLRFDDNSKLEMGNGSDLQLYHDGSHSRIVDAGSGNMYLAATGAIWLQNPSFTSTMATFTDGGSVTLRHNNSVKIETQSTGINVTGVAVVDGLTSSAAITSTSNSNSLGGTTFNSTVDMNSNNITNCEDIYVKDKMFHAGDVDTYIGFTSDTITFSAGATTSTYSTSGFTANGVTVDGTLDIEEVIEKVSVLTTTTGSINLGFLNNGSVLYFTANQTANRTINFRGDGSTTLNSIMSIGQSMTASVAMTQGSTAYYLNAYQVDGTAVTPKWSGGSAPTGGNASGIDVYTFTIIKTANATFTVLASVTQYA